MARQIGVILAVLLFALPARGESLLRGQWQMSRPSDPAYVGIMLVDVDGRATYDAPMDNGRAAHFRGYIASITPWKVEIVFADGSQVVKAYCVVQSSDLLRCQNRLADESLSNVYTLTRLRREVGVLWH